MRTLVLVASGIVLGASAFAATPSPGYDVKTITDPTCVKLRDQLRAAITSHARSDQLEEAEYWGMEGRSFCLTDDPRTGSDRYRRALQALNVKPAA
jgi:hypothetical protein